MPHSSRFAPFVRGVLLPLGLVAGTVAGLGSYYEASDDTALAWLFSGVAAAAPVPAVPLYFHGYGQVLAALFGAAPAVPWLGVLLAGLLGAATWFTFAVLDGLLRPRLPPGAVVLALVAFFALAWLEHWLWFSYVRVGVLLAGAAVLYAAQRPGRRGALALGLVGLGAAWLLRPSLAVVAFGAVVPAAVLLAGGWRRAAPVLLGGALLLAGASLGAAAGRTPAQEHTQVLDGYASRVLDFDLMRPHPHSSADTLAVAATNLWLLGDAALINPAFYRRAYSFDAADYFGREMPAKLRLHLGLLGRDYFPILWVLLLTAWGVGPNRRLGYWLVQAGFVGALVFFAGILKLPPRLALPLLDFWLLTNLAFVLAPRAETEGLRPVAPAGGFTRAGLRLALGIGVLTAVLYGAKTWHRQQVLGQEQRRHLRSLAAIDRAGTGRLRIVGGGTELLKSLSPFRTYGSGTGRWLLLSGWPSHDASQRDLRRHLSGTDDQTECLRRLAVGARAGVRAGPLWVLTPAAAAWLGRRFHFGGAPVSFVPGAPVPADSALRFYCVPPGRGFVWPLHSLRPAGAMP